MSLFRLFPFLILKGVLANKNVFVNENVTESQYGTGVQLWRAQGTLNEDVHEEFYDRARFTEDIWKRDEKTIDFLIDKSEIPYITEFLERNNVSYKVLLENIEGNINETMVKSIPTRRNAVSGDSFTWTDYPSLAEINRYLVKMAATYPEHCSVTAIGKTAQRRSINMLKISNGHSGNTILVDSGVHGNEWTAVLSTLYFIDSIMRDFTKQPDYVKKRDWYVIPVLNPDGYEYSKTTDRRWRKNRRRFSGECQGVNLNRNFPHNWGQRGSSQIMCSSDYCGPLPFSEEETKAFKSLVDGKRFSGYISVHSAGTKVIYPWSTGADLQIHQQVTKAMGQAMNKISNNHFTNGNAQRMGVAGSSGMSIDWMFFEKEIRHAYVIETRGAIGLDLLQPKEILPALKEVRVGLFKFAEVLK